MTGLVTHRQKKVQAMCNVLKNFADARILPFYMELNGTDLLCTEPKYSKVRNFTILFSCYLKNTIHFILTSLRQIVSHNAFYDCFIARNNFAFNLLLLGHKRHYIW